MDVRPAGHAAGPFDDEHGAHRVGTCVRDPAGTRHPLRTRTGCRLHVKEGHLAAPPPGL